MWLEHLLSGDAMSFLTNILLKVSSSVDCYIPRGYGLNCYLTYWEKDKRLSRDKKKDKGAWRMPKALSGEEGRDKLRKG